MVTPTVGHQTDTAAFSNKGRKENPAVSLNLLMDLIPYSPPPPPQSRYATKCHCPSGKAPKSASGKPPRAAENLPLPRARHLSFSGPPFTPAGVKANGSHPGVVLETAIDEYPACPSNAFSHRTYRFIYETYSGSGIPDLIGVTECWLQRHRLWRAAAES